MARADFNNSTTAPVDQTRRGFLSNATSIAAGGTVLAMATTHSAPAIASQRVPDPILEAIEAHKGAYAAFVGALDVNCTLEKQLPRDRRRSSITVWETRIVETDDPRWIAAARAVSEGSDNETAAAMMLINVEPTTLTGAAAILEYVAQHERRGDAWPDELEDDDGRATSFYRELCQNVAAVLSQSEHERWLRTGTSDTP
jgi:hypothetical protein